MKSAFDRQLNCSSF